MPIPVSSINISSFGDAVATIISASTTVNTTTYVTILLIMSAKHDAIQSFFLNCWTSLARKGKGSGLGFSSAGLSLAEMWAEFQRFMASWSATGHSSASSHSRSMKGHCSCLSADHSKPSSSASHLARQQLPRRGDWHALPAHSTQIAHLPD